MRKTLGALLILGAMTLTPISSASAGGYGYRGGWWSGYGPHYYGYSHSPYYGGYGYGYANYGYSGCGYRSRCGCY
jgi:hypothetical protein